MAAPETIYGVHENHSVKRSGQAGGAARANGDNDDNGDVAISREI